MEPLLSTSELYRFYRAGDEETLALRGVAVQLVAGELVAVTGPSGSGKSTLLACLSGLDEPDGGNVWLNGRRLSHQPEAMRAALRAQHIGLLFQSGNLLAHLTVRENVRLAQKLAGGQKQPSVDGLLDRLGIRDRAEARPGQLSGGETARAGLAVALANDPVVLLTDEPTGELDRTTELALLGLLLERAADGKAVLVASHSRAVTEQADRIIRLHDGKVSA